VKIEGLLLSPEDEHLRAEYAWHLDTDGYVIATTYRPKKTIRLARLIVDAPPGVQVDHSNLNKLDNRRQNLRLATESQQMFNRGPHRDNVAGFRGVTRNGKKWQARIMINRRHLGTFDTAAEAAYAYNTAARDLHGEFYYGGGNAQ